MKLPLVHLPNSAVAARLEILLLVKLYVLYNLNYITFPFSTGITAKRRARSYTQTQLLWELIVRFFSILDLWSTYGYKRLLKYINISLYGIYGYKLTGLVCTYMSLRNNENFWARILQAPYMLSTLAFINNFLKHFFENQIS